MAPALEAGPTVEDRVREWRYGEGLREGAGGRVSRGRVDGMGSRGTRKSEQRGREYGREGWLRSGWW
eukprot:1974809-Rhodomonas_salina.1